jgi:hypothetical protein
VDARTGEAREVELFVMTLGASNYTYAEASLSQRSLNRSETTATGTETASPHTDEATPGEDQGTKGVDFEPFADARPARSTFRR